MSHDTRTDVQPTMTYYVMINLETSMGSVDLGVSVKGYVHKITFKITEKPQLFNDNNRRPKFRVLVFPQRLSAVR